MSAHNIEKWSYGILVMWSKCYDGNSNWKVALVWSPKPSQSQKLSIQNNNQFKIILRRDQLHCLQLHSNLLILSLPAVYSLCFHYHYPVYITNSIHIKIWIKLCFHMNIFITRTNCSLLMFYYQTYTIK